MLSMLLMRRWRLFAFLFLASTVTVYSQSYVRFNVGYGLPMGSQQIGTDETHRYDEVSENYTFSQKGVYGSFGKGLSVNAAYGLTFTGILGVDLELGYLSGSEYKTSEKWLYSAQGSTGVETQVLGQKVSGFSFAPSITLTAPDGSLVPYTRVGPVFGLYKVKNSLTYTEGENSSFDRFEIQTDYTGGVSIGLKGAVGVIFNPAGKFQFFTELSFVSMSYSPKEGELTSATYNGEDVMDDVPSTFRKFKFKDSLSGDDEPEFGLGDQLRQKYPLSALTLQAGIRLMLN